MTRPADLVLAHGIVRTQAAQGAVAAAVAVRDGRVVYVGDSNGVREHIGRQTNTIDLHGRCVVPGFIDAHAHTSMAWSELFVVSLLGTASVEECCARVAEFAAQHPEMQVLRGAGWSDAIAPGGGPRKEDLDAVESARPVVLESVDYHSVWGNSKALELAGITGDMPDPPGGSIGRTSGSSEPSGVLREWATHLIVDLCPDATLDERIAGLRHFEREIAGPNGLTAFCDPSLEPDDLGCRAFRRLAEAGTLNFWQRSTLRLTPQANLDSFLEAAITERAAAGACSARPLPGVPLYATPSIKFFVDGVVEGHTAFLLDDYADAPGDRGVSLWTDEELAAAFVAVDAAGFQIHVHSIGDAATRETLDALEVLNSVNGVRDRRPLIAHVQLVTPEDVRRFAELGAVAMVSPYWFVAGESYRVLERPYLGSPRADRQYPLKSFLDAGVRMASASDYPVSTPVPLEAMRLGMQRCELGEDGPMPPLWPEEAAGAGQMLASVTVGGAYAMGMDESIGSIEAGKSADLVVLSRDPVNCPPCELPSVEVELTVSRGAIVYAAL